MNSSRYRCHELHKGRASLPGQIYMITTVTHQRRPLFKEACTGRIVARALIQAEASADTLAYVVMPDHLHWLMQLKEGYSLSQVVQFVKSCSARNLNRQFNRSGAV